MKAVSGDFMQAVYAPTRRTGACIDFGFVDPAAKQAASLTTLPAEACISRAGQLLAGQGAAPVGKLAQLEPGHWQLDGSFALPCPADEAKADGDDACYGFWGDVLSDGDGLLPEGTVLRMHFAQPVTLPGVTLLFDEATGNLLADFDLVAYNEQLQVLRHSRVRGNQGPRCVVQEGVQALKWLDVVCLKTNRPYRRVRLLGLDFGLALRFEGDNLLSVKLVSECDPLSESLPGNELNFTAVNDGSFDFTRPDSHAHYLQRRQLFHYRHCVAGQGGMQWADMGQYALHSWRVSDTKVELRARLDYSALEEHPFRRYSLCERLTAGALAQRIFEDCGWTRFEIDEALYHSPVMPPYTGEVSNKEALRLIAAMAGAVVLKLPDGLIRMTQLCCDDAPVDAITYQNALRQPTAQSSTYYNAVKLTTTLASQKPVPGDKPIAQFGGVVSAESGVQSFVVPFDHLLYDETPVCEISGGVLEAQALYANYAFITVRGSGAFTYTVTGHTVDLNTAADLVVYAPWYQTGEELHTYPLKLPMLVQATGQQAQYEALRDWCAQRRFAVLAHRLRAECGWRQNPALDIGDVVEVQLDKSGRHTPLWATKHTLSYTGGALKGTTRAIGPGTGLVT